MRSRLLIVGIDPGTTVGYALLDIDGNVIEAGSSKTMDFSTLLRQITEAGLPVLVGTDKASPPSYVADFAIKAGAKLISPKDDLLVRDKKELTKRFPTKNSHEEDALASAIFAYRKMRPLLEKIDNFVKKEKREDLADGIKKMLISTDGMSIRLAYEMLTGTGDEDAKLIKDIVEKKEFSGSVQRLYEKLRTAHEKNLMLKKKLEQKEQEAKALAIENQRIIDKYTRSLSKEKAKYGLHFKERQLHAIASAGEQKDRIIANLEKDIVQLRQAVLSGKDLVIVKELDNLGQEAFEKEKKKQGIAPGDYIHVRDCSIFSASVIGWMVGKSITIITPKPNKNISKKLLVADAGKVRLARMGGLLLAKREDLAGIKDAKVLFRNVLDEYQSQKRA